VLSVNRGYAGAPLAHQCDFLAKKIDEFEINARGNQDHITVYCRVDARLNLG
jgi:hypothetical protein